MEFDFETIYDRAGKDALAVDGPALRLSKNAPAMPKDGFDFIPMWVADMNFSTSPAVVHEIEKRLSHPVFGYFKEREEYYQAIISWQAQRHGVQKLQQTHILHFNGVHGFICAALEVFSRPKDKILVHTPVYTGFLKDIEGKGRIPVFSPLKKDEDGIWRMDYEDMDEKLRQNDIHLAIFCSPHNPTGRVWELWELEKAAEVFRKHNCLILSDEIWSDLVFPGAHHIPTQMVNAWTRQNTLAAYSPSKAFNLAGMNTAYAIVYNPALKSTIAQWAGSTHLNTIHILSMYALIGSCSSASQAWLSQLLQVLDENIAYVCTFIQAHFPGIHVTRPQATYLLFLDCHAYCAQNGVTLDTLLQAGWDVGVGWQDGRPFHCENSIRMNLALPFSQVQEAMRRLDQYVFCPKTTPA